MTQGPTVSEVVRLLSRRMPLIRELVEGEREKRELDDRLDVSRSTVNRALRELETAGLVEQGDGRFRTTLTGRLVAAEYDRFVDRLEALADARPLLSELPAGTRVDLSVIEGAEVLQSDGPAPHSPLLPVEEHVAEADVGRGLSRAVTQPRFIDLLRERTTGGELEFEMIYEPPVVEHVLSAHPTAMTEMVESGRFRVLVADDLPHGMGLFDDDAKCAVDVIVYTDGRELTGVIENDTPEAVEWAERQYERARERATDISDEVPERAGS